MEITEPPPIEEINVNVDVEEDLYVKKENNDIEFAEVKVEPASDEFVEAFDCDMGVFVAMFDVKIEEPLDLSDIIDNEPSMSHSNELANDIIKEEDDRSEPTEEPHIESFSISIENEKSDAAPEEATTSSRSVARQRDQRISHSSMQLVLSLPHKCLLCEKAYGRSTHLWRHYEQAHGCVPDSAMKKLMTAMKRRKVDVEIVAESSDDEPKSAHASVPTTQSTEEKPTVVAPDKTKMAQLMYCHLCDRKYANQGLCATHMLEVHQIELPEVHRSFKCWLCEKSYTQSGHFTRHYERTHKDVNCNVKLKVRTDPMHGTVSVTEIIPQINVMPSDSIAKNDTPAEVATSTAYCEICDRDYETKPNLMTHLQDVHQFRMTLARPHKCVILTCGRSYKSRVALTSHFYKDHGGNPEQKEIAKKKRNKSTASAENGPDSKDAKVKFDEEAAIHGGNPEQKEKTKKKRNKSTASAESGPDSKDSKVKFDEEAISSKARSTCLLCDKRYANHASCAKHMLKVHNITMPDVERPYGCHQCRKAYVKLGHLQRHLKVAHGVGVERLSHEATAFECFLCHETFNLRNMLKKHLNKMHLPIGISSICPTCGISTPRLTRHIAAVHVVKEVQCHICHQIYSHPSRLTNHLKIHTLPVQCDLCPKRFPNNGSMRQHRRYHTQEKPYVCKHCGARFIERSTCTQHQRIHTGEKP